MTAPSLNRYTFLREIGAGGMAEVWKAKAHGPAGFEKLVAIKRVLPHLVRDPEFIDMFVEEAKLVAQLDHPNIVRVYDFGIGGDDARQDQDYFIAMEYVAGQNLAHVLRRARERNVTLPPPVAFYIAAEAAKGLGYAHAGGHITGNAETIVHRDVSPQNILVSFQGDVKLTDFGIAKVASQLPRTAAGILRGKAAYVSPEQANLRVLDHRSDLFSLGSILYEMITLERLMVGSTVEHTIQEIRDFDPINHPKLEVLTEGTRGVLESALKHAPADRFDDAMAMEAALINQIGPDLAGCRPGLTELMRELFAYELEQEDRDVSSQQPIDVQVTSVMSGPPPELTAATKTVATNAHRIGRRWPLAAMLAVLIAAGVWWMNTSPPLPTESIAIVVADFNNLTDDPTLAGVSAMLAARLAANPSLDVYDRPRAYDVLRRIGADEVDRIKGRIDETVARKVARLAGVRHLISGNIRTDPKETQDPREYQIELVILDAAQSAAGTPLHTLRERGTDLAQLVPRAATRIQKALGVASREEDTDQPSASMPAYTLYVQGEQNIARNRHAAAQDKFNEAIGLDPTFALAHYRLAYARHWRGVGGAATALDRAFELVEGGASVSPDDLLMMKALRAFMRRKPDIAIGHLNPLIERHAEHKEARFMRGDISYHYGRVPPAIEDFRAVLALDPTLEAAHDHLLRALVHVGDEALVHEQAANYLQQVQSVTSFIKAATALIAVGDFAGARSYSRAGIAIFPANMTLAGDIVAAYVFERDWESAERELEALEARTDLGLDSWISYNRMYLAAHRGRIRGAHQHWENTRDTESIDPTRRDGRTRRFGMHGYFAAVHGNESAARQSLSRARGTEDRIALRNVALAYMMLGDETEARLAATKMSSRESIDLLLDAHFACDAGDTPELVQQLRHATDTVDYRYRMSFKRELARCYVAHGQLELAAKSLRGAEMPMVWEGENIFLFPLTLLELGRIEKKLGQPTRAWEELAELWSDGDADHPWRREIGPR